MEIGNVCSRNHCFSSFKRSNGAKPIYSKGGQQPPGLINRSTASGLSTQHLLDHIYGNSVRFWLPWY